MVCDVAGEGVLVGVEACHAVAVVLRNSVRLVCGWSARALAAFCPPTPRM